MSRWVTVEEIAKRYAPKRRLLVAGLRSTANREGRQRKQRSYILAVIHLPALACIPEDLPQNRTLDLAEWQDRDFAQEMAENYAVCNPHALPTFFAQPPTQSGERRG